MTGVYIVTKTDRWDGWSRIVGVFSTVQKAENCKRDVEREIGGDWRDIGAWKVDVNFYMVDEEAY